MNANAIKSDLVEKSSRKMSHHSNEAEIKNKEAIKKKWVNAIIQLAILGFTYVQQTYLLHY
jgi:hypothetical protein